jgi:hypothetical protein
VQSRAIVYKGDRSPSAFTPRSTLPRSALFKIEDCSPPYELVPVQRTGDHPVPPEYRDRILIHTVHDGDCIPPCYYGDERGKPRVERKKLEATFIRERDWGANLVAHRIAAAMGLPGYARCRIARVLLDFNRFPGSSFADQGVHALERLAIHSPFSEVLTHAEKVKLLGDYYDGISDYLENKLIGNKLILIAVHTYDEHNPTKTRRPHLSLINSVLNYQRESRMPYGVFDPMYPDVLGESTCSRILRDRISLNLERNSFRVSHNHPYPLPEGSMEVRAQVWFFFDFLRRRFQEELPETRDDPPYKMVWQMLLNTNLRLQEAETLRSYLHRYRRVPRNQERRFLKAREAYEKVEAFLQRSDVVSQFRRSKERPSSLGLEVRKDLVCSFDEETGRPLPMTAQQRDQATLIGNVIANAVTIYFETDRHFR